MSSYNKLLLSKHTEYYPDYLGESSYSESYEYSCACGNGTIVEEHDSIPGYRDHHVFINCPNCSENFTIDTSHGINNWLLVAK